MFRTIPKQRKLTVSLSIFQIKVDLSYHSENYKNELQTKQTCKFQSRHVLQNDSWRRKDLGPKTPPDEGGYEN